MQIPVAISYFSIAFLNLNWILRPPRPSPVYCFIVKIFAKLQGLTAQIPDMCLDKDILCLEYFAIFNIE